MDAGDRFELPMHLAYETGVVTALPAEINFISTQHFHKQSLYYRQGALYTYKMERNGGIEPPTITWKDIVLPLN